MKINLFHILPLLSCTCAFSQVNDSIFIPKNNFYNSALEKVWENPIQYSKYPFKDFTETELSVTVKDLNLKRTQTAESVNQYQFKTQGIFGISNNLRLLGSFDYRFVTEKDVAYNLSGDRTEDQMVLNPHYIFAPKKGNWESQIYNVKGGISYTISNFDLGATIDYKNFNSFRKNDPRPSINTADYSGKLFAGYHFKKHQLSIQGQLGRKSDAINVDYVNAQLSTPANEDYFIRFSNGYGRLVNFNAYNNFGYKTIVQSGGAGYAYRGEKNIFTLNYTYSKSMQTLFGKSAEGYTFFDESLERMKYRLKNFQTDANYWYKGNQMDVFSNLNFQSITGDNYSLTEMGQNYRMTLDKLSFKNAVVYKNNDRTILGLNLNAAYSDFSAIDLLGETYKYVKSIDLELNANRDVIANSQNRMNVQFGARGYFPISNSLIYTPTTANTMFFENVIANDHQFDQTTKIGPQVGIQFFQKIKNNTQLKIFSNFASLFALDSKMKDAGNYNGNPNLYFNAGLTLFY